jgi:HD-GYP domain-containing protein (c-di-GMP phosphodiesterase class II)
MASIVSEINPVRPAVAGGTGGLARLKSGTRRRLAEVNRELWLLLAIFAIAALVNSLLASGRMVLAFYTIPTILSAYFYGRRHAVLTALASVFLVLIMAWANPGVMGGRLQFTIQESWFDFTVWGGMLMLTAYLMGTLYERTQAHLRNLRQSYEGILLILQHIASDNKYSQNHPSRVSLMATKVAEQMELTSVQVEDVRAAALLHEVDKLGITRETLYRAGNLSDEEVEQMKADLAEGRELAAKDGGALQRIIPILLAYHAASEKAERAQSLPSAPLEARILLVADAYDAMTSAKDPRISPSEAMQRIVQRAGIEYDPGVVDAMVKVFRKRGQQAGELAHGVGAGKS